jgi:hypothetical protein
LQVIHALKAAALAIAVVVNRRNVMLPLERLDWIQEWNARVNIGHEGM